MTIKDDRIDLVLADPGVSAGPDQRLLWELATQLSPTRYRVHLWLPGDGGMDAFAEAAAEREIDVVRLRRPRGLVGERLALWLQLRRARPALLHLHEPFGPAVRMADALAGIARDARLVVTQRRAPDWAPTPLRAAERRLARRAEIVMVPGEAARDQVVRELAVPRAHVRVMHDGVDLPDFEREAAAGRVVRDRVSAGPLRPLVLCPEPAGDGPGPDQFLDAVALLRQRGVPFVAAFCGERDDDDLRRRAEARGIGDRVHVLGALRDPGPMLAAADVVVLPSASSPALDVLLESLVRARPVVAAASPVAAEWIEDGLTGRIVSPGDSDALAAAIESLVRHGDAARRLGAAAARRVRETHSWSSVVETVEAAYDEVLGLATFAPDAERVTHAKR